MAAFFAPYLYYLLRALRRYCHTRSYSPPCSALAVNRQSLVGQNAVDCVVCLAFSLKRMKHSSKNINKRCTAPKRCTSGHVLGPRDTESERERAVCTQNLTNANVSPSVQQAQRALPEEALGGRWHNNNQITHRPADRRPPNVSLTTQVPKDDNSLPHTHTHTPTAQTNLHLNRK